MDHIAVYGPDNDKRLTGKHETAPWNKFSYGIADRGASIRVPHTFVNNGYKGYLEDRRPNSQGDPYQIASQILKTIASVPTAQIGGGLSDTTGYGLDFGASRPLSRLRAGVVCASPPANLDQPAVALTPFRLVFFCRAVGAIRFAPFSGRANRAR